MMRKRFILASVVGGLLVVAAICVVVAILVRPNANTFLKRVGVPLPPNSTDVQAVDSPGWDGGEYWMSAKLSQTDFLAMTKAAGLERDPKILQQYPGVFVRRPDAPAWWTSSEPSEKDIYFATRPDGYVAASYQDGRVYLRRSTY